MIWNDPLEKSDLIFVLCSHDIRVASYAAKLWKDGFADKILFSGGVNFFTKDIFPISEAKSFAEKAIAEGVDPKSILVEDQSTNTGENILYSKLLLADLELIPKKAIVIQKPSMTLRVKLALQKQWPELIPILASPDYPFLDAPHKFLSLELFIHELVGDFQRLFEYPKKGFQDSIEIPDDVMASYDFLMMRGYRLHLIKKIDT